MISKYFIPGLIFTTIIVQSSAYANRITHAGDEGIASDACTNTPFLEIKAFLNSRHQYASGQIENKEIELSEMTELYNIHVAKTYYVTATATAAVMTAAALIAGLPTVLGAGMAMGSMTASPAFIITGSAAFAVATGGLTISALSQLDNEPLAKTEQIRTGQLSILKNTEQLADRLQNNLMAYFSRYPKAHDNISLSFEEEAAKIKQERWYTLGWRNKHYISLRVDEIRTQLEISKMEAKDAAEAMAAIDEKCRQYREFIQLATSKNPAVQSNRQVSANDSSNIVQSAGSSTPDKEHSAGSASQ